MLTTRPPRLFLRWSTTRCSEPGCLCFAILAPRNLCGALNALCLHPTISRCQATLRDQARRWFPTPVRIRRSLPSCSRLGSSGVSVGRDSYTLLDARNDDSAAATSKPRNARARREAGAHEGRRVPARFSAAQEPRRVSLPPRQRSSASSQSVWRCGLAGEKRSSRARHRKTS